jgi:hypothetical protein
MPDSLVRWWGLGIVESTRNALTALAVRLFPKRDQS